MATKFGLIVFNCNLFIFQNTLTKAKIQNTMSCLQSLLSTVIVNNEKSNVFQLVSTKRRISNNKKEKTHHLK